jgi:hypothetical protein
VEVRSASTSRVSDARQISQAPRPIPTLSQAEKPRSRVEGIPEDGKKASSRIQAVPDLGGGPAPQGIQAEPMGSRIPQAARPDAIGRSFFETARAEPMRGAPVPAPRIQAQAEPAAAASPRPRVGQAAPQKSAQVSYSDAKDLADNLDDALSALAERPSSDPSCVQAARQASGIRDQLRAWLAQAKGSDSYTMTDQMLGPLDRAFACGFAARRTIEASKPNTGAYVALGAALVAAVALIINL